MMRFQLRFKQIPLRTAALPGGASGLMQWRPGAARRLRGRGGLLAAAMLSGLVLAACGGSDDKDGTEKTGFRAEIRRTAYGIPHIKAADERGLGYGVGYAYAQDNFCLLAEHFVTVRGERARYFGEGGLPPEGTDLPENLISDFFYRSLNEESRVEEAWRGQSRHAQALLKGFAAGYNRYLDDRGRQRLPEACRGAPWVREIDEHDMVRLTRDYGAISSLSDFAILIANARPPSSGDVAAGMSTAGPSDLAGQPGGPQGQAWRPARRRTASNALALGGDATDNGRGMLLGNPHFPWHGVLRMYQLHLTIPGKMDVMGATLPGLPIVGIGFTRTFAWTHTTNTAMRYTLYRLDLDPDDPTRYLVDGRSKPMTRRTVSVEVKGADGKIVTRTRDLYGTEFGPIVAYGPVPWDRGQAYAVRDANTDNHRMVEQWYAMNRAGSLDELKSSVQRVLGNPWNNTIAADAGGRALFMSVTPTPYLAGDKLTACVAETGGPLADLPIVVLRGNTRACAWDTHPDAPQAGILPGSALPVLERRDYVQNANDSAWLANPAAPLTGYSPLASMQDVLQSPRTRLSIVQIEEQLGAGGRGPRRPMSLDNLQTMALDNRAYLAELILDDLLSLCPGGARGGGATPSDELVAACSAMADWNRRAELDASVGYGHFEELTLKHLPAMANLWRVPFDPADPVNTPRGLNVDDPAVAEQLREAMAESARSVAGHGWGPNLRWRDVQRATRGSRAIPIHGGTDELGIYNVIYSDWETGVEREVTHGTSYLQAVAFGDAGPRARAILSYSQSTDPASAHFADQTEKFSKKEWIELPFSQTEIDAQAVGQPLVIAE